jgi:GntR family transcriptional regulator
MNAAEIAEDLTERIRAGEYPSGTKLPSYRELGELYSVGFSTIAKVVLLLRERGIVVGVPGRGVYVPEDVIGPPQ